MPLAEMLHISRHSACSWLWQKMESMKDLENLLTSFLRLQHLPIALADCTHAV